MMNHPRPKELIREGSVRSLFEWNCRTEFVPDDCVELKQAGKNHPVVLNTLQVLETCVKNCGRRFHVLVCAKAFVQDLIKLIGAHIL